MNIFKSVYLKIFKANEKEAKAISKDVLDLIKDKTPVLVSGVAGSGKSVFLCSSAKLLSDNGYSFMHIGINDIDANHLHNYLKSSNSNLIFRHLLSIFAPNFSIIKDEKKFVDLSFPLLDSCGSGAVISLICDSMFVKGNSVLNNNYLAPTLKLLESNRKWVVVLEFDNIKKNPFIEEVLVFIKKNKIPLILSSQNIDINIDLLKKYNLYNLNYITFRTLDKNVESKIKVSYKKICSLRSGFYYLTKGGKSDLKIKDAFFLAKSFLEYKEIIMDKKNNFETACSYYARKEKEELCHHLEPVVKDGEKIITRHKL